jgi:hypothetical protein
MDTTAKQQKKKYGVMLFCVWMAYLLAMTVALPIVCPYRSFHLWFGWVPTFLAWDWMWELLLFFATLVYLFVVRED